MFVALVIVLLFVCGVLVFVRPVTGFIAGASFGISLFILGIVFERIELTLGGPAVFLVTLLVIAFKKWGLWARRISIVCGLGLLVTAGFVLFGEWGLLGLAVFLLFVVAMIGAAVTSGLTTAAYVTSTIGSSVRQNLPLPMAMEMAAAGQNNRQARILRNIKKWLVEGYSLSESLKLGYPRFPGYATALVAVGERIGQVPQVFAALEQDLVAKVGLSKKIRHIPLFYPPVLLLMMFTVVLLLLTFVFPRFQGVLEDMAGDTKLPAATLALMRIVRFITDDFGWLLGLLLILGFPVGGAVYVRIKSRPRQPEKPYAVSRIGDFIRWHIPFVRWYEWNRAMQRIAGMLRLSLNAGCTVNESIANTLQLDINDCFKGKLREWLDRVERGDDIGQAARQCGMGSAMAWAFADVNNHRNMLDIFETLESSYRWGFSRAATLARYIIGPCETLCLGLMVGFIAYAFFAALVAMIYASANSVVP
jgi:type II secretory pathway component PulF